MRSNWAKRLGSIRIRCRITGVCRRSFSGGASGCGHWNSFEGMDAGSGGGVFPQVGAIDEPSIQSETDRYIAWPAQALTYKLGQLKFRELRERAQKELGPKFDIRTFHDEMLNGGTLPLDLLEARTDRWIAEEKAK